MSSPRNSLQVQTSVIGLILCFLCGSALAKNCDKLVSLKLDHATITSAQTMPAGSAINDPAVGTLPAAKAE
jgi:hypothetical protein